MTVKIDAKNLAAQDLCRQIKNSDATDISVENVCGQRYIAAGLGKKDITLYGTPGNALGAYLDGSEITVYGNAQDATGDTMNHGDIIVHGSAGDATGYAMRGGRIFVRGNAGYRAGIHMKAYQQHKPTIIIGGRAGSFLGEYQAGGTIIVLGLDGDGTAPVGNFACTGMHGGKMILRCTGLPEDLPAQVVAHKATAADMEEIQADLSAYCTAFSLNKEEVMKMGFYVLEPNTKNPYKQLYCYA